jgi:hypothetical protein
MYIYLYTGTELRKEKEDRRQAGRQAEKSNSSKRSDYLSNTKK